MKGGEKMKLLHVITFLLLVIGGFNWGLVGLFNYNLVASLFSGVPSIEQLIYILVGASAVYLVVTHAGYCKQCSKKSK